MGPTTWANSDAYEAFMGRWSRLAADAALAWLQTGTQQRWLDVGCGTGASTEAIVRRTDPALVVAIDPSPDFLAQAQQRISDQRVRFQLGQAEAMPVESGSFDVCIACLALHFMDDPYQGLLEMTRAAKPGGVVTGYIWDITSDQQFMRPFWAAATAIDPAATEWEPRNRQKLNSVERVLELFRRALLMQVDTATLDFPIVFRSFDDYWFPCQLDGSSPVQRYVNTLTEQERSALRERLWIELPIAEDGSIPLRGRLWAARGSRLL